MKLTPTVQSGGLTWAVYSRNERSTTHQGRHFFAMRCRPGTPWVVDEINQAQVHHSKTLARLPGRHETQGMAQAIIEFAK